LCCLAARWALGVLIYTMLQGEGPFGSWKDSELQVYTRIARRSMQYPDHFSAEVVSLVDQVGPHSCPHLPVHTRCICTSCSIACSCRMSGMLGLCRRI